MSFIPLQNFPDYAISTCFAHTPFNQGIQNLSLRFTLPIPPQHISVIVLLIFIIEIHAHFILPNVKCGGTAAQDSTERSERGSLSAVATHDVLAVGYYGQWSEDFVDFHGTLYAVVLR
jgi:hypothetical protein